MTFISYAQNFEDVLLWRALKDVRQGFYLDVGAQHPDIDSVTRAFYDQGWSGINFEPVPAAARRLREARPRDLTLQLALGAAPGRAAFHVVDGTGLSTLDPTAMDRARERGFAVHDVEVEVDTLAAICRRHVRGPIHFLKIDVEGSEAAVLAGADFSAFRPWIVLVEATAPLSGELTHAAWEQLLLDADYRFAWFDGLNRFYVAGEHAAALLPALAVPPNVGDNFLRAADTEWAGRIGEAEGRAAALKERLAEGERGRCAAEQAAEQAYLLLAKETALRVLAETRVQAEVQARADLQREAAQQAAHAAAELRQAVDAERAETELAREWLRAMRSSSSWRVTAPLRRAVALATRRPSEATSKGVLAQAAAEPSLSAPSLATGMAPVAPAPQPPLRTVHQFHSGSATGDGVTGSMFLIRRLLREMGYRSEIYVEQRDPDLADELRLLDELPNHANYVILLHHSLGQRALDRLLARPMPMVLYYHNITPPEHLPPGYRPFAALGREQLPLLARRVRAALGNSEYTAMELRREGFDSVVACPLLFDASALRRLPPRVAKAPGEPFTVLFVGRVIEAKGQLELIEAFADFNRAFAAPARLVLVGRHGGPEEPYCASLLEAIRRNQLDGQVVLTGPLPDAERNAWYAQADLYVSLSHHEGFGIPLVEAMAAGVPVLAWPAGAVALTVGDGGELLQSRMSGAVADHMVKLARDRRRLASLAERGRRAVDQFALERQLPKLAYALGRAGAAPPADPDAAANLRHLLRFSVTGHVNGTYSLAAVNTALALTLEAERPGRVRVLPVEGGPTAAIDRVLPECRAAVAALAGRPAFEGGVEVVISQHYPVWAPPQPGDLPLSLFFWEESLIPGEVVAVLNRAFRGVLAPSRFVSKALVDSGVCVPVRVLPLAPPLEAFEALAAEREGRQPGEVFTFLHVSSCFPRKGVDLLLAAYARAFRAGDKVRLVVKGFPNPENDVPQRLAALQAADPGLAEIRFINEDLPLAALLQLFREADAVVLPTRGEGYNLPAAEAIAAGVPLIVTGLGGHREFCGPAEARLLAWDFAFSSSHLASPGSVWAEPRLDDLVDALRDAVTEPDEAAARARRARDRLLSEQSPARTVDALERAALDLLLSPPRGGLRVAWVSSWDVRCGIAEYSRHFLESLPRDGIDDLVILADSRTAPGDALPRSRPVWRGGDDASVPALAQAVAQEDPDVLVLQHQPGLLSWAGLATLLAAPALRDRATLVILHNTANLLDAPAAARAAVLAALAACGRVLVHTLADLNRLAALGLVCNVTLLPHGTPKPRPGPVVRALAESDPILIGSYGFFLPRKGLPELIRAFALLRRRWTRARLRLVNADYGSPESSAEIALCRQLVAAEGLADEVEFHTDFLPHDRSLDLLAECDVIVLPYQTSQEASSAAMRSALVAGIPVAVTPLPLFEEATDAVLRLPGTEPEAIAAGLGTLIQDTATRAAVTKAAERWLDEREWSNVAARLAGMIRGLAWQTG